MTDSAFRPSLNEFVENAINFNQKKQRNAIPKNKFPRIGSDIRYRYLAFGWRQNFCLSVCCGLLQFRFRIDSWNTWKMEIDRTFTVTQDDRTLVSLPYTYEWWVESVWHVLCRHYYCSWAHGKWMKKANVHFVRMYQHIIRCTIYHELKTECK